MRGTGKMIKVQQETTMITAYFGNHRLSLAFTNPHHVQCTAPPDVQRRSATFPSADMTRTSTLITATVPTSSAHHRLFKRRDKVDADYEVQDGNRE